MADDACIECGSPAKEGFCKKCLSKYRVRGLIDIASAVIVIVTVIIGSVLYEFSALVVALLILLSVMLFRDGVEHYEKYQNRRS
jgi:hypothetical protein